MREHRALVLRTLQGIPLPEIPSELSIIMNNVWAKSTLSQRRSLWNRFLTFRSTRPVESFDRSAAVFVATMPEVALSTKKTYISGLAALLGHLSVPTPTSHLMLRGLKNMGANIPTDPATPALRSEVQMLIKQLPLEIAMPIWLMWKTASRWDDVAMLTKESFLVISEKEIIIRFGKTKSNREMASKPSSLVQILDRFPMRVQSLFLSSLRPQRSVMPLTRDAFVETIQNYFPHLTAHSFKKGANDVLVEAVENRLLDKSVLPLILKHADKQHEFPVNTIRYSSQPERYARILGTGNATILL